MLWMKKIRIAESSIIESLKRFVKAIVEVFEDEYLRSPNDNDTTRLLALGEERGFPGMLGSIDCMHWKWKNCPSAWQDMYCGHVHEPTIILEVVASHNLWIWHAFFGLPGSHNDINVLHRSPLFAKLAEGQAPKVDYSINGHDYTMGYYLVDGRDIILPMAYTRLGPHLSRPYHTPKAIRENILQEHKKQ